MSSNLTASGVFRIKDRAHKARQDRLRLEMEGESLVRLKGSLLADYVRMIRANKDKDWDKYLVPMDWEIINGSVLASNWYALGPCRRIGGAVFKEIANEEPTIVAQFGMSMVDKFLELYPVILVPGDPGASVAKLIEIRRLFMRGFPISILDQGPGGIGFFMKRPDEFPEFELFEAFCHQFTGLAQAVARRAGGEVQDYRIHEVIGGQQITLSWKPMEIATEADELAG